MVGIGTAVNDDPRLNGMPRDDIFSTILTFFPFPLSFSLTLVRLLPTEEHTKTPQPIILDPHLRLPPSAKLFKTLRDPETPHAKAPWILCRDDGDSLFDERRRALESVGGRIVPVPMPNGTPTQFPPLLLLPR